jgi:hypothetical protein
LLHPVGRLAGDGPGSASAGRSTAGCRCPSTTASPPGSTAGSVTGSAGSRSGTASGWRVLTTTFRLAHGLRNTRYRRISPATTCRVLRPAARPWPWLRKPPHRTDFLSWQGWCRPPAEPAEQISYAPAGIHVRGQRSAITSVCGCRSPRPPENSRRRGQGETNGSRPSPAEGAPRPGLPPVSENPSRCHGLRLWGAGWPFRLLGQATPSAAGKTSGISARRTHAVSLAVGGEGLEVLRRPPLPHW